MNGAMALDCENTISRPNSTKTTTIGTSQYFFSWRRNCRNSERTRPLLITTSIHARIVMMVSIPRRIRPPAGPRRAPAGQRVLPRQTPHHGQRYQHDRKQHRQQDARVHVSEDAREPPPHRARQREQRRIRDAEHDQHEPDAADDFRARDAAAPEQERGDRTKHDADRQAERSFRIRRSFSDHTKSLASARPLTQKPDAAWRSFSRRARPSRHSRWPGAQSSRAQSARQARWTTAHRS